MPPDCSTAQGPALYPASMLSIGSPLTCPLSCKEAQIVGDVAVVVALGHYRVGDAVRITRPGPAVRVTVLVHRISEGSPGRRHELCVTDSAVRTDETGVQFDSCSC